MAYRIHCHVRENQFYETILDKQDEVIDFVFENRDKFDPLKVYAPADDGMFNCVLMVSDGCPRWGEYSLLYAARIRHQELTQWPDIAANPEYKRVTLEQTDAYYDEHIQEVLDSLWPEPLELAEMVYGAARENNAALFCPGGPAAAEITADGEEGTQSAGMAFSM